MYYAMLPFLFYATLLLPLLSGASAAVRVRCSPGRRSSGVRVAAPSKSVRIVFAAAAVSLLCVRVCVFTHIFARYGREPTPRSSDGSFADLCGADGLIDAIIIKISSASRRLLYELRVKLRAVRTALAEESYFY